MRKWRFLSTLLLAIFVVVAIQVFGFLLVTIPDEGLGPTFRKGDRLVANRWSYGLRPLFLTDSSDRRYLRRDVSLFDWIAFNAPCPHPTNRPDTTRVCVARCLALPADTVWMGAQGRVSDVNDFSGSQIWPLEVPAKGKTVIINPWNATLYAVTINAHEGREATLRGDTLLVDGQPITAYTFQHDYYWLTTENDSNLHDSRTMGFIPQQCLIGRVSMVLYSLDGLKPRWNRTFLFHP